MAKRGANAGQTNGVPFYVSDHVIDRFRERFGPGQSVIDSISRAFLVPRHLAEAERLVRGDAEAGTECYYDRFIGAVWITVPNRKGRSSRVVVTVVRRLDALETLSMEG